MTNELREASARKSKPETVADRVLDLTVRDVRVLASELVRKDGDVAALLRDSLEDELGKAK